MSERALPPRLAIPTVVLYAAGYPIGAASVAVMSPFLIILLRFAASALLLWGVVAVRRTPLPDRRSMGHAMVAGLMTQGVQFLGLYWALDHGVPSGLGSLLIALNPVVTAGLMALVLSHRESRRGVLALVLATAAVALACAPKIVQDHGVGPAIGVGVLAMLGLSAGGVYQGRYCANMDPWLVTALGLTASTPVAGVLAVTSPMTTSDLPRALALVSVMVVFSSIGAMTLYSACIRQAGARAASILFAVIPAAASVMGWAVLGEELSAMTIGGLALGAAACLLQARASRSAVSEEAAEPSPSR
ncbi:DMT family transporter [Saccharopolyspora sp. NFXS83]|uniref:DMT family transporter n=1 Tax=Saccharopolyspora sp. NFXS83 TaxID=2993560 RepID=UPI00224B8E77|nr:DMT family transporter [Saccharopolyspora sp. NFXS83]MCX2731078.1 DMT family transporter [Saccharopolyspora sp. NFXS83]